MKIGSNASAAVEQLKQAHQSAGVFSSEIREKATPFYDRLTHGNFLAEGKLKLKLAVSPGSRDALKDLWRLVFDTPRSEVHRHQRLESWVANNKPLISWMSKDTQKTLFDLVGDKKAPSEIDAGINRAEAALAQAFGTAAVTTEQRKAVDQFGSEAHTDGAVIARFGRDIDKLGSSLATMLVPGAKAALKNLRATLVNPKATDVERRDAFSAFRQANPRLMSLLDVHIVAGMSRDLSVADWSDGRFQAAEAALHAAFAKAAA